MGPRQWSRGKVASGGPPAHRLAASMGPRQWSRGKGVQERPARNRGCRFNGATTMESWKGTRRPGRNRRPGRASMGPRQWSRGKAFFARMNFICGSTASMGPRQWSRGRGEPNAKKVLKLNPLQWGHDNGVVERPVGLTPCFAASSRLQWGHDNGVVERCWCAQRAAATSTRFNGATTMESWKGISNRFSLSSLAIASMGPRRWSRGKGLGDSDAP